MFENLSQREKTLALAVVCLLPLMLVFFSWMTYNSKYQNGRTRLTSIDNQIKKENQSALDAISAGTRRNFYYKEASLPTGEGNVRRYQDWLLALIEESGMKFGSLDTQHSSLTFRSERQGVGKIAKKSTFKIDATGSLDQIMRFCFEIENIDLLHKIKSLNLAPVRNKTGLTGISKASFQVELLTLEEADESRDFLSRKRELPKTFEEYKQIVVARNIFGLANNAPTLSLRRQSFELDEAISFKITGGRDPDKDELTYELLDNGGIEGAKVELRGKYWYFESEALEVGDYEIKIGVNDDGFPSKSAEAVGKIVVKEPRKKPVAKVVKKPKHAGHTKINRISWRDGVYDVKIGVRLTGEVFELKVGDEFKLDDKIWIVKDIEDRKVTLETDGRILEYRQRDFLDQPRKETKVPGAEAVGANADDADSPSMEAADSDVAVDTDVASDEN